MALKRIINRGITMAVKERPIKAGVIGPADLVGQAAHCAREMEGQIEVNPYPYEDERQIFNLYQEASAKNEVVLFTGPLPYFHVQRILPQWVVPSTYVQYSPEWLYPSLLRLLSRGHDIKRVSVDSFGHDTIKEVFNEIGFDSQEVLVQETSDEEELYRFHLEAYREGCADCVVTSVRNIFRRLKKENVPVEWAVPTNSALRELLEKGILLGQAAREAERKVAVGILELDDCQGENLRPYEYERQKLILEAHQVLLAELERIGAFVTFVSPGSFLFIATLGSLKEITGAFQSFELMDKVKEKVGIGASVGVGFGGTPWEAGQLAHKAVQMARRAGGNCCYLLSDSGELWGPLGNSFPLKVEVCVTDNEAVFRLAERVGISPPTLSKMLAALYSLERHMFSSSDLARVGKISLRSAQRMIKKLLEAGIIKSAGVERMLTPGRNRHLYVLSLESKEVREVLRV